MSNQLRKVFRKKPPEIDRGAKIWDHYLGEWVDLTEEEIDKRWPPKGEDGDRPEKRTACSVRRPGSDVGTRIA